MQASIETISTLERKMTIAVPADQVENQVKNRLNEAARTIQLKGFRKGKVPVKVVQERYGQSVRQEVLGELMSQTYYEALGQHSVRPASQPRIEAKSVEPGKDLEFVATFEVYPEVKLGDLAAITIERKVADINEADIDKMVETLRKQRQTWQEVERPAADGDQVVIDFTGKLDGQSFEGGSATGTRLILGSNRMIDGFEAGIVGMGKGQEKVLSLTFPATYHKQELAGKPVEFTVKLQQVNGPVLPELNDTFFTSFDVKSGGEAEFRVEVKANMAREMRNAIRNNVKNQVVSELIKLHTLELPKSLVASEINQLRQQAVQQYGAGRNVDEAALPAELFQDQAQRRVSLGLIMNEVIVQNQLKVDPAAVRKLVEELAESYEHPQEVVKWYYSNKEQLAQIEAMALEEAVIDHILSKAQVNETSCSYEDALKPSGA
ncbi:MAG TPA: trigger factor [Candidatus Acidoferrum sp.]|nr:trigger factor [Candidatus Acidoferrum sp.]